MTSPSIPSAMSIEAREKHDPIMVAISATWHRQNIFTYTPITRSTHGRPHVGRLAHFEQTHCVQCDLGSSGLQTVSFRHHAGNLAPYREAYQTLPADLGNPRSNPATKLVPPAPSAPPYVLAPWRSSTTGRREQRSFGSTVAAIQNKRDNSRQTPERSVTRPQFTKLQKITLYTHHRDVDADSHVPCHHIHIESLCGRIPVFPHGHVSER